MNEATLEAIEQLVQAARLHRNAWSGTGRRCGCAVCHALNNYDLATQALPVPTAPSGS